MDFENSGDYYAAWHIKDELSKEKQRLIGEMYKGSIDGFWGVNDHGLSADELLSLTVRVEEITRILDALRLGQYKAP